MAKPALLAMTAGICWGTSGLVMRYLSAYGFDAVEIGTMRLLIAAGVMCMVALRCPCGMRVELRQLPWLAIMGAGCLFFYSLCYVLAVQAVSLSLTAVLIYTSPAMVMLLSAMLLHEPLTRHKLLALTLTFSGCSLAAVVWRRGYFPLRCITPGGALVLPCSLRYCMPCMRCWRKYRRSALTP